MAFNDWSTTAASNASVGGVYFAEGQLPSTVNNSNRQVMADLAEVRDGTTISTGWHVKADGFVVHDQSNTAKKINFDLSGASVGATSVSFPTAGGVLVARTSQAVIQTAYGEYTANSDLTAAIPADDTKPQNNEGTEILAVTIAPLSALSKIRLTFQGSGSTNGTNLAMIAAIFKNSDADSIAATLATVNTGGQVHDLVLEYEDSPATTSPVVYKVRVGPSSGTMRLNGTTSSRILGGAMRSTLTVREVSP